MIRSLTSLRGVFILFIFFHHCLTLYPGGGTMAVAFFFVLGGFCMTLNYLERIIKPEFSYRAYITRRCIKFFPLHWLCLLACVPLVIHGRFLSLGFFCVFGLNAALLQTWIPVQSVYFSYNMVSWYLADTMFFATMFPFLVRLIWSFQIKGRALFALTLALLYAVVAALVPQEQHHAILYIGPYMRLMDFVLGIYLALLYRHLKFKPTRWLKNGTINHIIIVILIGLLVGESCALPEGTRLYAPVYWPLVAILILHVSLLDSYVRGGGGKLLVLTIVFISASRSVNLRLGG